MTWSTKTDSASFNRNLQVTKYGNATKFDSKKSFAFLNSNPSYLREIITSKRDDARLCVKFDKRSRDPITFHTSPGSDDRSGVLVDVMIKLPIATPLLPLPTTSSRQPDRARGLQIVRFRSVNFCAENPPKTGMERGTDEYTDILIDDCLTHWQTDRWIDWLIHWSIEYIIELIGSERPINTVRSLGAFYWDMGHITWKLKFTFGAAVSRITLIQIIFIISYEFHLMTKFDDDVNLAPS